MAALRSVLRGRPGTGRVVADVCDIGVALRVGDAMTVDPICHARPDRYEPTTQRCNVCRLSWDVDDPAAPTCPRQVATRSHDEDLTRSNRYVSALPPPFVDF